jgi:hypothetical protein
MKKLPKKKLAAKSKGQEDAGYSYVSREELLEIGRRITALEKAVFGSGKAK